MLYEKSNPEASGRLVPKPFPVHFKLVKVRTQIRNMSTDESHVLVLNGYKKGVSRPRNTDFCSGDTLKIGVKGVFDPLEEASF